MVKAKKQNEGKFHQATKGITIHTVDVKGCRMLESSECAQLQHQHQRVRGTCCLHPPVVALRAIQERRGWTAAITRHTSGGGCGLLVQ